MDYQLKESLGRLTKDVSRLLGKLLGEKFKEAGFDIDSTEWMVLVYLVHYGPLTQNELAAHVGRDKVAIKRTVDKLEEKKFARRKKNKGDRRFNKVTISKKGRTHYPQLEKKAAETLALAYGKADEEEINACIQSLQHFQHNIEEALHHYQLAHKGKNSVNGE